MKKVRIAPKSNKSVVCDECGGQITLASSSVEERYLGAMYTGLFLVCPKCHHEYLFLVQNITARRYRRIGYKEGLIKELARINGKQIKPIRPPEVR